MDEELFVQYTQALNEEEYEKAISLLKEDLKKKPKEKSIELSLLYHIACAYRLAQNLPKAKEYFTKALEIDPNDSSTNQGIGIIYQLEGNYDKAIEHLKKAIKLEISSESKSSYYNNLGHTYSLKGNYEKALESYFKGISNLFEGICDDLEKQGSMEVIPPRYMNSTEWAKFADKALLINTAKRKDIKSFCLPNSEEATNLWKEGKPTLCWKDIGETRFITAQFYEGVRAKLMSDDLYALITNNIGVVYHRLGIKDEAKKWYKESIALTPDNVNYQHPKIALEVLENESEIQ